MMRLVQPSNLSDVNSWQKNTIYHTSFFAVWISEFKPRQSPFFIIHLWFYSGNSIKTMYHGPVQNYSDVFLIVSGRNVRNAKRKHLFRHFFLYITETEVWGQEAISFVTELMWNKCKHIRNLNLIIQHQNGYLSY